MSGSSNSTNTLDCCYSPSTVSDEELRKLTKPIVSHELISSVVGSFYGPATVIKQLDSYDDCNFLVEVYNTRYLLKVHNGVESADYIVAREASKIGFANALYRHVKSSGILTNEIVPVKYSADISIPSSPQFQRSSFNQCFHVKEGDDVSLSELPVLSSLYSPCILAVQLLTWVEGTTMSSMQTLSIETIADAGIFLGKLRSALDKFPEPSLPLSAKRFHAWDTKNISTLRKFTPFITNERRRSMVHGIIDEFETQLLPLSQDFPQGIIHGDFNDANILLDEWCNISAVIDFGDSIYSWRIFDLSIAMAYAMLSPFGKTNHSLAAAAALLRGFHSVCNVTVEERRHLRLLVACRLALSCTYGAFSINQNPENLYLTLHSEPAWKAMELICSDETYVDTQFHLACQIPYRETGGILGHRGETGNKIDCVDICTPDPPLNDLFENHSEHNDNASLSKAIMLEENITAAVQSREISEKAEGLCSSEYEATESSISSSPFKDPSHLLIQKGNDSHKDHRRADKLVVSLHNQNESPHFLQPTVAAAIAIEETQKKGSLNKLKQKEAHAKLQKTKEMMAQDIHLEGAKTKEEHDKNDSIAALTATVELMQKQSIVAHSQGHNKSKLKAANVEVSRLVEKEKERRKRLEKKIMKVLSPTLRPKSLPSTQAMQRTQINLDLAHTKTTGTQQNGKQSNFRMNYSLLTPKSEEKKLLHTMNKSIKSMEQDILKAVLPPRKRLSFPSSRHREQLLMTPQNIPKNRSAHTTGGKIRPKPNSGLCHRKWNSRLVSSPQPCERCLKIHTTPRVRKEFEVNMLATSPCVNKTRGGCSPKCGYFPRNVSEGERPVVLCRHCFYALHRYVEF